MVSSISTINKRAFFPEDVCKEGDQHTKALHMVVQCKNMMVAIINNESSLNVYSLLILDFLRANWASINPNSLTARAFASFKRIQNEMWT